MRLDPPNSSPARRGGSGLIVWAAQGFGLGRVPVAPGTFGSLGGLIWVGLLVETGSLWACVAGTVAGLAVSVWLCGAAEKILHQTDPGSVVLDEIAALPVCFLPWLMFPGGPQGGFPETREFFSLSHLAAVAALFVLFRAFDVLKPWPVRQSQRLPGGWGVTADDVLAALYVALIALVWIAARPLDR
ncbi:MAG: phosphatidylglycerophosphatase A [Verrucomicrobia bacterium]|nr:phosphatidylglycerophosphatase A [Verrucomicrobiota bacterium]